MLRSRLINGMHAIEQRPSFSAMSGNRFVLGLGTSGPQVMEGLHGVPFAHPLGRMRETLDVIRLAFAGERIRADGPNVRLPLPDGEGRDGVLGWLHSVARSHVDTKNIAELMLRNGARGTLEAPP